jgi:small subunit ribosomal protein S18
MGKSNPRKRANQIEISSNKKLKKRISPLGGDPGSYIDYKDVDLLRKFLSDRAKIRSRRVTGNDSQQQKNIANAIKNAREMGLIAYTSRVTTQRRGGGGGRKGSRDYEGDYEDTTSPKPKEEAPVETGKTEAINPADTDVAIDNVSEEVQS